MDKDRRLFLEETFDVTRAGILLPARGGLNSMIERLAYEPFLEQCRASLTTCEELVKKSDPDDHRLVFQCVSGYLVDLETIINTSSLYRQQSLELAAHFALLKRNLGWHCCNNAVVLLLAQDAVDLSRESGNIRLLLSAYSKQAWGYLDNNQRKRALETATIARNLLEEQKEPLPVCIRGGTYSTLSVMQARNGQPSDTARKKAMEEDPGNEVWDGMLFTQVHMWLEQGRALYYAGKSGEALNAHEQLVDPDTLEVKQAFKGALTEILRIETILDMSRVALKGKDRDMKKVIRYWKEVIEGAKRLNSGGIYSAALAAHDEMELAFPDEQEVHDLLDHVKPDGDLAR